MNWTLVVTKPARRDLERLPDRDRERILKALHDLQGDPFTGESNIFSSRVAETERQLPHLLRPLDREASSRSHCHQTENDHHVLSADPLHLVKCDLIARPVVELGRPRRLVRRDRLRILQSCRRGDAASRGEPLISIRELFNPCLPSLAGHRPTRPERYVVFTYHFLARRFPAN